jgi:hypothetical protein
MWGYVLLRNATTWGLKLVCGDQCGSVLYYKWDRWLVIELGIVLREILRVCEGTTTYVCVCDTKCTLVTKLVHP